MFEWRFSFDCFEFLGSLPVNHQFQEDKVINISWLTKGDYGILFQVPWQTLTEVAMFNYF